MQLVILYLVLKAGISKCALFGKDAPPEFRIPASDAVDHVDPMIGNGGDSPNGSGGMIPSTGPPFAMTRWVAQTRENYVSVTPYNQTDTLIHGLQGTHQPAIWMGESGQVVVMPGLGATVRTAFETRGLLFDKSTEISTPSYYRVRLQGGEGNKITVEQSSTSRVGHLRLTFSPHDNISTPYVVIQATRAFVLGSDNPANTSSPVGGVYVDVERREVSGFNPERQDEIIGPNKAKSFAGYFVARFDVPLVDYGCALNDTLLPDRDQLEGKIVSAYVRFPQSKRAVHVRIGTSFISIDQARANIDAEVPDGQSLEATAKIVRGSWAEKLDRIQINGASEDDKVTFYTAFCHTLQYPYEQSEGGRYYSGYDDRIHEGSSYSGYSIWIYRAEWSWLILFAPERIPSMITSMLQDYQEGGWLPMWKNIVETNIMIGTHADSLIAEAVLKNRTDFNVPLAYEAVYKDAMVPPVDDATIEYADRQENVGYEVRAGLSSVYRQKGWVADDVHSESASRTLAYAYDDYAVSVLANILGNKSDGDYFARRSLSYKAIYHSETGFMEARNASGAWAGPDNGWTEGDKWAYTFDVVHDIPGLVKLKGGNDSFVHFLDEHFEGGHNDHTNEPSHHIPYLYTLVGAASRTQQYVRSIALSNYNSTPNGLSGNEDCGQMSAWYLFSALGFYPVDPLSNNYVVGVPFFDHITVSLPGQEHPFTVDAPGASVKSYIKSLQINRKVEHSPLIAHTQLLSGSHFFFEMASSPQPWASSTLANSDTMPQLSHEEL